MTLLEIVNQFEMCCYHDNIGHMLDEIDKISAKAHNTCIMTYEMKRRLDTLMKAVK